MQGYGKSLWLMHGMFRANGRCGYVKKPNILLETDVNGKVFNPKYSLPVKTILKVIIHRIHHKLLKTKLNFLMLQTMLN